MAAGPEPADASSVRRRPDRSTPAGQAEVSSVRERLAAAYASSRADGRPWTARTLAEAAGCGRTAAARFLAVQRQTLGEMGS